MDINAANLRSIYTGLSTAFNVRLQNTTTFYGQVAMMVNSITAMNEYPRLDDLPGIREWVGDRVIHDLSAQTYIIRNRKFESTIAILRDQIEDDQIGMFTPVASEMGLAAAEFPDQLVFPLLKSGDTTRCYDGQYFFDTDHPGYGENGEVISVSNFQPGAGPAWFLIDDTRVIKPMVWQTRKPFKLVPLDKETDENVFFRGKYIWGVDGRANAGFGLWHLAYMSRAPLTPANYQLAREAMGTIRKRSGQVINIMPNKLLVPRTLETEGRKLLNAELIDGGDTNIWKGTAELSVIPLLG